jgi:hypothetical protein
MVFNYEKWLTNNEEELNDVVNNLRWYRITDIEIVIGGFQDRIKVLKKLEDQERRVE